MTMEICTFFGHRDAPETVAVDLRAATVRLIEEQGVSQFYVGTQGRSYGGAAKFAKHAEKKKKIIKL